MTDKVQKIREEVERIQLYTQSEVLKDILDYIDEVQKEPVSTKDKLLALSDGRLHLGWIDDAKVVEFEECLMQFYEDMNNIPKGTDSQTRLKDADGVMHSYSKKLMFMAKEEPVSEDLEEASVEWFNSVKYKSDLSGTPISAFKAGAKWQKEQMMKDAVDGTARPNDNEIWCNLASFNLKDSDIVKVIVIKED